METKKLTDLEQHVKYIANGLQDGFELECCPECGGKIAASFPGAECLDCSWSGAEYADAYTYLQGALDIQYIVNSDRSYIAARVLVAFGGPNIWINTQTKTVEGYWWSETAFESYYDDPMGLDEALEELWNC